MFWDLLRACQYVGFFAYSGKSCHVLLLGNGAARTKISCLPVCAVSKQPPERAQVASISGSHLAVEPDLSIGTCNTRAVLSRDFRFRVAGGEQRQLHIYICIYTYV